MIFKKKLTPAQTVCLLQNSLTDIKKTLHISHISLVYRMRNGTLLANDTRPFITVKFSYHQNSLIRT